MSARFLPLILVFALPMVEASPRAKKLSYGDLVGRLYDMKALAVPPVPGEQSGCFSSRDRSSRYDESQGRYVDWHTNQDASGYLDASMAAFERQQSELAQRWQAAGSVGNPATGLAEAAQEGLKSWMSLQRSLFDAWTGRTPEPNEKPED